MAKIKKRVDYIPVVGRRKSAVARVRVSKKDGEGLLITINNKDFKEYFPYFEWQDIILQPLKLVDRPKAQISAKVTGGGPKSQAEAVRLAIARAMAKTSADVKKTMRKAGLLTRDSRVKERKKPGLKRARRAPQWSKR